MKILFLTSSFYPKIGGVETHVWQISKLLVSKGHEVFLITQDNLDCGDSTNVNCQMVSKSDSEARISKQPVKSIYSDRKKTEKIRVVRLNFGPEGFLKKFRIWWQLWKNREIIKSAQVVHCHDVFFWYLPFRFLYPRKPAYLTFHGYEARYPLDDRAIFVRRLSQRLSWGNICVGSFIEKWYKTKANYKTYGGTNRIQNSEFKRAASKDQRPIIRVLFVGRLEQDTGVLTYLEVLRLLREKGVDFEFEACGDGSLRDKVGEYGKAYGFVEDLSPFIQRSDVVFASSYLSLLQVLACRKPIFAVYENPLKRDYLMLSPFEKFIKIEKDPKKLVREIIDYLKNPDSFRQKIEEGFLWAEKQTWDKVANLYLKLWGKKIPGLSKLL